MFEEQIKRGVQVLNEKKPGWAYSINIESLNIITPAYCVLGQVYGGYSDGLAELRIHYVDAGNYGFTLTTLPSDAAEDWDTLTQEWKETIRRIQEQEREQVSEPYPYSVITLSDSFPLPVLSIDMNFYIDLLERIR